jgi:hypothetical protein
MRIAKNFTEESLSRFGDHLPSAPVNCIGVPPAWMMLAWIKSGIKVAINVVGTATEHRSKTDILRFLPTSLTASSS